MVHIELWMALSNTESSIALAKRIVDQRRLGTRDDDGYRLITKHGQVIVAADGKVLFIPAEQLTWFSKSVMEAFEHGKFGQIDVGAEPGICDHCGRPW